MERDVNEYIIYYILKLSSKAATETLVGNSSIYQEGPSLNQNLMAFNRSCSPFKFSYRALLNTETIQHKEQIFISIFPQLIFLDLIDLSDTL